MSIVSINKSNYCRSAEERGLLSINYDEVKTWTHPRPQKLEGKWARLSILESIHPPPIPSQLPSCPTGFSESHREESLSKKHSCVQPIVAPETPCRGGLEKWNISAHSLLEMNLVHSLFSWQSTKNTRRWVTYFEEKWGARLGKMERALEGESGALASDYSFSTHWLTG